MILLLSHIVAILELFLLLKTNVFQMVVALVRQITSIVFTTMVIIIKVIIIFKY